MDLPESGDSTIDLTEVERAVLTFERSWWKYAGAKETEIQARFDMSPTRYYQVLNALNDRPQAAQVEPLVVAGLRRVRGARQQQRPPPPEMRG